ncbi:MAG TPA: 5-oxoprolinase subunit PxpB [Pedobacter sp.]|nr:5-oxoprolinase subunit PxpB [Pedobacter sp.]
MNKSVYPLGDSAVALAFGPVISEEVRELIVRICAFLDEYSFDGLVEYVPAYVSITIFYDPLVTDYPTVAVMMEEMLAELEESEGSAVQPVLIEIPVLYGGGEGPDLELVAAAAGISPEEVIALHTANEYVVHMIGFAPGFPYLGGMDERIAMPRKETPRAIVPAGSVGIAGLQTGVYPIDTPGGWQIIGTTPLNLFDADREVPALLKAGNRLRFVAITELEFDLIKEGNDGY